jgi:hypothetical protein
MAREAGFDVKMFKPPVITAQHSNGSWVSVGDELKAFEALVRADERKSKSHSLGPGEMEMSLRREHNGELFEYRYRFTKEQVLHSQFHLINTASSLDAEMTHFINSWEAK